LVNKEAKKQKAKSRSLTAVRKKRDRVRDDRRGECEKRGGEDGDVKSPLHKQRDAFAARVEVRERYGRRRSRIPVPRLVSAVRMAALVHPRHGSRPMSDTSMKDAIAVLLAGGPGERLWLLTRWRCLRGSRLDPAPATS